MTKFSALKTMLLMICVLAAQSIVNPAYAEPTVTGLDGNSHRLSQVVGKGKWVILNIWGTRCPPCLDEIPELIGFHDSHVKKNATVIGLAVDFPSFGMARKAQVAAFVDDNLVSYPIWLADGDTAQRMIGTSIAGLPTTVIYAPDGSLATRHTGTVTQAALENFISAYETQKLAQKRRP